MTKETLDGTRRWANLDTIPWRERKKAAQRQKIIDASFALFDEKGYAGTSVDDIARAAEISRGTFFNYFSSKAHLALYYRKRHNDAFYDSVHSVVPEDLSCLESIIAVYRFRSDHASKSPAFTDECMHEIYREPHFEREERTRFAGVFRDLLARGVERGEVRGDVDLDFLSNVLVGIYFYAGDWSRISEEGGGPEKAEGALRLFWAGVGRS